MLIRRMTTAVLLASISLALGCASKPVASNPQPVMKPVAATKPAPTPQPTQVSPIPKKGDSRPKTIPLKDLLPSTMALAQLSRDFERERRLKQRLSHEADIPINTRDPLYMPYAQGLVKTLKKRFILKPADYGKYTDQQRKVLMRIKIEKDGKLAGAEVLRASPIPELNEAALAAIHASTPFEPLPDSWGFDKANFYLTFQVDEP